MTEINKIDEKINGNREGKEKKETNYYEFVDKYVSKRKGKEDIKHPEIVLELSNEIKKIEELCGKEAIKIVELVFEGDSGITLNELKSFIYNIFEQLQNDGKLEKLINNYNKGESDNIGKIRTLLHKLIFSKIKEEEATIKEEEATINEEEATIKEEEATIKEEEATIKEEEATIKEEEATIKEEEVEVKLNNIELKKNLLINSIGKFKQNYSKQFADNNYEDRKNQIKTNIKSQGYEQTLQSNGITIDEYAEIIASKEIVEKISQDGQLKEEHKGLYKEFVGNYDALQNMLGNKNLLSITNSSNIYYTNPKAQEYINGKNQDRIEANKDGVEGKMLSYFGNYNSTNQSETNENEEETHSQQQEQSGTFFIDEMYNLLGRKMALNGYLQSMGTRFSKFTNYEQKGNKMDGVDITDLSNDGNFALEYELGGKKLGLRVDEKGEIKMADLLSMNRGVFQVEDKPIKDILKNNSNFQVETIAYFDQAISQVDLTNVLDNIKGELKEPKSQEDVENNRKLIQSAFEKEFQKIISPIIQKASSDSYTNDSLNDVIVDQEVSSFMLDFCPSDWLANKYEYGQDGGKLAPDTDGDTYDYLKLLRTTMNYQTPDEKVQMKEIVNDIIQFINTDNISNNVNSELLIAIKEGESGNDLTFSSVMQMFTDNKLGLTVLDLNKMKQFYKACVNNEKWTPNGNSTNSDEIDYKLTELDNKLEKDIETAWNEMNTKISYFS